MLTTNLLRRDICQKKAKGDSSNNPFGLVSSSDEVDYSMTNSPQPGMMRIRMSKDGQLRIVTPVSIPTNPTTFDPPGKVAYALALLLDADELEETRKILEREQALLLTDVAELILASQIQKETEVGEDLAGDYLLFYHTIIRTARQFGFDAGWSIGSETAIRLAEARRHAKVTRVSEVAFISQDEAKRIAKDFTLLAKRLEAEFS